jgi:hypothetical protein
MTGRRIAWHITQVVVAITMFLLFFTWIPWLASEPIAQVSARIAAQMPPGCPAVFGNHGHYSCFWPGLIRDHQLKFAALTLGLAGCWAFFVAPVLNWRRFLFRKPEGGGSE